METQQKSIGERVLTEIEGLREDLIEVRSFADLLGARLDGQPSYLEATSTFHEELLSGLSQAVMLLQDLHAHAARPEIDSAIRRLAGQADEA